MKRTFLTIAMAAAGILGLSTPASAQDYPVKGNPISLIVPFAPGGASDILARLLGQKFSEVWNTPVVVQNRPGGEMIIALQSVARAEADGYTMGLTTSSFALNKVVRKDFPMDPVADLSAIGFIGKSSYVLAVNPELGYKTFDELAKATTDQNKNFSYASCCFGTYFAAEMLKATTDLEGVHVPYKGSSPALQAILAKDVQYIIDTTTATKPHIASGKLVPLMVTGRDRSQSLPDVPSLTDAGIPGDFDIGVWYGLTFPAGTPENIVQTANAALNEILAMPDVKSRIESLDIEITPNTPQAMTERVTRDLNSYTNAIKVAKLEFGN